MNTENAHPASVWDKLYLSALFVAMIALSARLAFSEAPGRLHPFVAGLFAGFAVMGLRIVWKRPRTTKMIQDEH